MQWLVSEVSPGNAIPVTDRMFNFDRKEKCDSFHTSEASANQAATDKASSQPGKQFAVFGIVSIFETTKPKIIRKELDANGQIVVAGTAGARNA